MNYFLPFFGQVHTFAPVQTDRKRCMSPSCNMHRCANWIKQKQGYNLKWGDYIIYVDLPFRQHPWNRLQTYQGWTQRCVRPLCGLPNCEHILNLTHLKYMTFCYETLYSKMQWRASKGIPIGWVTFFFRAFPQLIRRSPPLQGKN